ncbi:alpha/beta hydrolase [Dactylosporangium sp. NPDC000555]|uniref:alpha/beta fold hydrolase n=1 Tax=Dactylosporangium sp. NPDC000555 TaxID=3154260 RepID=UPI00332AF522
MTTSTSASSTGHVKLRDGCGLYFERRGSGTPVLLLHAGAEDATGWVPQAEALAGAGFEAITYERRGTGRSDRTGWPGAGAPGHARDAAELLDLLVVPEALVVGVSSGAIVALDLALLAPRVVRRAVVHEPPVFRHVDGGIDEFRRLTEVIQHALRDAPSDYASAYARLMEAVNGPDVITKMPAERWRMESANAEAFIRDDLPLIALRTFTGTELTRIAPAVRLSAGANSPAFLKEAAAALAEQGGWRHAVLPGQGHTPHLIDPSVFVELVGAAHAGD